MKGRPSRSHRGGAREKKPVWPWLAAVAGVGVLVATVVVVLVVMSGKEPVEAAVAPAPDVKLKPDPSANPPLKPAPEVEPAADPKPKAEPKPKPSDTPAPKESPKMQPKPGTQASVPLLSNVRVRSVKLEPLVIEFSIDVDSVKGTVPFEKKSGLWFCFGTPTTVPSLHVELDKALKEGDDRFFLNMRGPGFYAAQCSIRQDPDKLETWQGTISLGKDVVKDDEVELPSAFGSSQYKLAEMPISWVYYDSEKRLSNELKAVVDLKAGKVVTGKTEKPAAPDESWKPWAAEIEPLKPGGSAAVVTEEHLPHKPGTTRRRVQTFFEDDGKPSSITTSRLQQRADGVLASKIISLKNSLSTIASEDLFPESITRHAVRNGFICVGYPKDDKKPDAEITWYRILKIGAKPGDRWSQTEKDDTGSMQEFKAAGTYKGKPCIVVGGARSYSIYVEGVGEVLDRSYKQKDGKWILSTEEKYE
jgi:hypothetical protein